MRNPKRTLSQNFLRDGNVKKRIAEYLNKMNGHVLEIGPGEGDITKLILDAHPERFTAVEMDNAMAENLRAEFPDAEIINSDVRDFVITQKTVVSSVPYSISRELLKQIIMSETDNVYLILQKEFAEKISEENIVPISLFARTFYQVKKEFDISRNAFFPVPNVESAFVTMKRICGNFPDMYDYWDFLVRICQNKRRTFRSQGFENSSRIMHSDCRTISRAYADKHIHTH